jgi:hypothetical protein
VAASMIRILRFKPACSAPAGSLPVSAPSKAMPERHACTSRRSPARPNTSSWQKSTCYAAILGCSAAMAGADGRKQQSGCAAHFQVVPFHCRMRV